MLPSSMMRSNDYDHLCLFQKKRNVRKKTLLFVNITSMQDQLPLKQAFPITRLMEYSLFINNNITGCDVFRLKHKK